MSYQFTIDDEELNAGEVAGKGTPTDLYRIELPASASALSRQIAKAQAKRAERDARRRRKDLSTVRESDERHTDEMRISSASSDIGPSAAVNDLRGRRSRDDVVVRSNPDVFAEFRDYDGGNVTSPPANLFASMAKSVQATSTMSALAQRQAMIDQCRRGGRVDEPMDDEEVELLAMLLGGCNNKQLTSSSAMARSDVWRTPTTRYVKNTTTTPTTTMVPPTSPTTKVNDWLDRTPSPGATSSIGDDQMQQLHNEKTFTDDEEEEDEFFDAVENTPPAMKKASRSGDQPQFFAGNSSTTPRPVQTQSAKPPASEQQPTEDVAVDDRMLDSEVEMLTKGVSLCRLGNGNAMTQSLVRVEEETTTVDGGASRIAAVVDKRSSRSSSVSPRPVGNEFTRNSPVSATFTAKASLEASRARLSNGNSLMSTPTSRPARSVLRAHNVNATSPPMTTSTTTPTSTTTMLTPTATCSVGTSMTPLTPNHQLHHQPHSSQRAMGVSPAMRRTAESDMTTPNPNRSPMLRPTSAGSNGSTEGFVGRVVKPDFECLQGLVQMQEEALRKAVLQQEDTERKSSWHSDLDAANRQSTSAHSSIGSLTSSKSVDAKLAAATVAPKSATRIPAPSRSFLPTPRTSALPKRVSSVTRATNGVAVAKPQPADFPPPDDCF